MTLLLDENTLQRMDHEKILADMNPVEAIL
jgi:hypothetical protein